MAKLKKGVVLSFFLIYEKGEIIEAWYRLSPKENAPKFLEALKK